MASLTFSCNECGANFAERDVRYVCPGCSAQQMPGAPTRGVLRVELDEPPRRWPDAPLHAP